MEIATRYNDNLINLKATELRLGLPGVDDLKSEKQQPSEFKSKKRTCADRDDSCGSQNNSAVSNARDGHRDIAPPSKKQVVGWPPVRNYRKNSLQHKNNDSDTTGIYVKVSMDGAPFLRKIDLKLYKGYKELHQALENMFQFKIGKNNYFETEGNNTSEYEPTYEDKDGDCMLVGDVPWDMFISSCKRLRIMRHKQAVSFRTNKSNTESKS